MIGVVMGIDEMRHLVADAVGGGDLIHGPLDVVTDRGRRVEQDDAVGCRQERGLVGPVRDPVEVRLDSPDVVPLLVDRGPSADRGSAHSPEARRRCSARVGCAHRVLALASLSTGMGSWRHCRAFESLNSLVVTRALSSVMLRRNERTGSGQEGSCSAGNASARCSTGCWTACAAGAAACWWCMAKRASARPRCSSTRSRLAREFRIARTSGVEAEMELPFAAVQQLCSPFLELMDRLPQPQHEALGVAFGLIGGARPPSAESVPGRTGGPRPAGRGRRGAASRVCC